MKPEMNNMQTRRLLRSFQKGIFRLALSLVMLFAATTFTAFTPTQKANPTPLPLPSVQGVLTIDFPSGLPTGAYAVVSPISAWQSNHPGCSITADIRPNNSQMDVVVSGEGSCISNDYEDMAYITVRSKSGTQLGYYLIYTEAGGTTILAIDLE